MRKLVSTKLILCNRPGNESYRKLVSDRLIAQATGLCDLHLNPLHLHPPWVSGLIQTFLGVEYKHILAALIDSEQMLLSIEAQLCTRKECKTFQCLTRTLCIATEEGLCGRNVLHSLRVHSCASMLNNICSEFLGVQVRNVSYKIHVATTGGKISY